MQTEDKNSLLYWYPKVKDLGIATPKTEIVLVSEKEKEHYYNRGGCFRLSRLEKEIENTIKKNFKFPVFIRTDHYSGKHDWKETSYVESSNKLKYNLDGLIAQSKLINTIFGGLPLNAIVVREFIKMDSKYNAWGGMPVNPERRYFTDNKKVICHHPYWIEEAIMRGTKPFPKDWKSILAGMNEETKEEIDLLTSYSEKVANVLDGFWSVDFCKAKDSRWILIDCAEGARSWHPTCEYAPKQDGRQPSNST
jgi:hypothetical protein